MSDEKVSLLPPMEQAADVSLYYHNLSNPRAAAALVEADRHHATIAARAEGEAAGYARAVEEVLDALLDHVATEAERAKSREEFLDICASQGLVLKLIKPHVDAIRAKFGDHHA